MFLVVREKTTRMQFLQKKRLTRRSILPPRLHLASDDLTEWAPLTSRLFFGADSPLALDLERSEAKLFKEDFLSVGNDTNQFWKRQFLRSAGKKKEMR